ncbi:transmembrane protein, putative (macronuclear) [Tetrahymena thermophila SB210]|uniref:Transmembrane protein, putative n=1 Tax=Tetrahymena thermophila (strain SB210) TaxID=312017 RepID=I7M7N8_TETTS|nr:transmembrane protein, putative [Tetrahymena thermophila SB210]EAR94999.2 transmembrane protein, putative [Tetrahymena thermophila SB210]|eukprot:XP_001015244.2 transmembrane protein, putative [Tetrahymena thermophila SB210]
MIGKVNRSKIIYKKLVLLCCLSSFINAFIQIKESSSHSSSDIVNTEKYRKFSIDPHLTNYAQDLEYFYIESDLCDMEKFKESYQLNFISNEDQDKSAIQLQEMKYSSRSSCLYTVQIKYECPSNKYLINYQLQLQDKVDSLNKWQIYWKKICTETKIPRNGLNIDLQINDEGQKISLVQNGVSISTDPIQLEKSVGKPKFIVYLQGEDQQDSQNEELQQENESEQKSDLTVLKNMVMQINEEIIQRPQIFFNEQEINIKIEGNLSRGGSISRKGNFDQSIKEEDNILLNLDCLQEGETEFQLLVPLIHFDDIKITINKTCGMNIKEELIQIERKIGLELIFFLVFLLFTVIHFIFSVLVKKQNVIQSYPFLLSFVHCLLQTKCVQNNQKLYEFFISLSIVTEQQNIKQSFIDENSKLTDKFNNSPVDSYINDEPDNYDKSNFQDIQVNQETDYKQVNIHFQQESQIFNQINQEEENEEFYGYI